MTVLFVMLIAIFCAAEADAITIAKDGVAECTIVVAKDASQAVRYGADELAGFLGEVTGTKFKIMHSADMGNGNIFVGPKAASQADPHFTTDGLGSEGIVIRTMGKNFILAGGEPRGTLYSVYTFLEDHVGCRWWTPTESTIPNKPTLTVDNLNIRYVPVLEYRVTSYLGASNGDFSARSKYNGTYHNLSSRQGGKVGYEAGWFVHTFWSLLPPDKYFGTHPEWYSLINGERTIKAPNYPHSSLCLTNEDMKAELIKNAKAHIDQYPDAQLISVSQNDDAGPPNRCECDKCRAIENQGQPSDLMITFVNSVAEALENDPAYSHMKVTTLAYHYTQAPPLTVVPRDNVYTRLCDIRASFSVPLSHPRNYEFADDLKGWSAITDRILIWDYVGNFTYSHLPHPNLRVLGSNIQYFVANGVKGYFAQGPRLAGVEMEELRVWVLSKLMWNPSLDGQKLIEEFCNGYFGRAGKHIIAYIDVVHDAVEATDDKLGLSSPPTAKFLSFDTLQKSWVRLKAAEEAVQDDAELKFRVQVAQLPVLYTFMERWDEMQEATVAAGTQWPLSKSIRPVFEHFRKIADRKGITALKQMPATKEMTKLELPIVWRFKKDPSNIGIKEKWFSNSSDSTWGPIKTTESWTSQDQGREYHGVAWYQISFSLPSSDIADKTDLAIHFGAVDGFVDIFLDGVKIGEQKLSPGLMWNSSFSTPISPDIDLSGQHRLVVRVNKDAEAAGIWKRVTIIKLPK